MAMTYADLKIHVQDITEMTFTDAQLSMFTKQAEQKIYGFIKDLPILRKVHSASLLANATTKLPADCLYVHRVLYTSGATKIALIKKDMDFLFEAYPETTETTLTNNKLKYYALDSSSLDTNTSASRYVLNLAPRFNQMFTVDVDYQYHPRSIVDTDGDEEQPWLGENYDSALLNGVLVEAARFMKAEPDILQLYDQNFMVSLQALVDTVNGKLQQDSFRPTSAPAQPLTVPAPPQPQQQQE